MKNRKAREAMDKRHKIIIAVVLALFLLLFLFGYYLDDSKTWRSWREQSLEGKWSSAKIEGQHSGDFITNLDLIFESDGNATAITLDRGGVLSTNTGTWAKNDAEYSLSFHTRGHAVLSFEGNRLVIRPADTNIDSTLYFEKVK